MEIHLRKATQSEWHKVLEFEWTTKGDKLYSPLLKENEIKKYIEESEVYFIYFNKERVGTISYQIKSTEKVYFDGLVIHPDYRQKGIGKKALGLILEKLDNFKEFELAVHPKHNAAINIYLTHGFEIEKWKDNYFGDGEPRLVLRKKV